MPLAALLAAMLASCELVPNVDKSNNIGCHSKHINCQRFDYQSFSHFSNSLNAFIEHRRLVVHTKYLLKLHDGDLAHISEQLVTIDDYIKAINQRPEDIYPLIKKAQEEDYSDYERFLMEQAFLRSIIDFIS